MTDADLTLIDCEIRAPAPRSRVKRVLQPMAEIPLQICCRCSDGEFIRQPIVAVRTEQRAVEPQGLSPIVKRIYQ